MRAARLTAWASTGAFAALAAVLAGVGAVPRFEAAWAALSVAAAFLPSGYVAPAGWRRRLAEGAILPVAYAFTMMGDPTLRRLALPPLLLLAGWAATAAGLTRSRPAQQPWLVAGLGLSVRAAAGVSLLGRPVWVVAVVLAASILVPWAIARGVGAHAGAVTALLLVAVPLQEQPYVALAAMIAAAAVGVATRRGAHVEEAVPLGWFPGAVGAALVAAALAPWGGLPLSRAFPGATWLAALALLVLVVAALRVPPALAGAGWLALTLLCGPVQPAPPDRAGFSLRPGDPTATLPAGSGSTYVIDLALANAGGLRGGTPVATVSFPGRTVTLRAGDDTAEWAHERADVRAHVRHPLPRWTVWRPSGVGAKALWGAAGRVVLDVPQGVQPRLTREPGLSPRVTVAVATAGPSRPTPPRDWTLAAWLLATAAAVGLLQLLGRTWGSPVSVVPWALLVGGSLMARLPVEPLRLLGERHAVDLCLAALVAAWLPLARRWLRAGRALAATAALLVPLAAATPHLTPSLYGDEPFHLIMLDSLAHDHDVDITNNYDLQRHPYNRIYMTGRTLLHSPVLAVLLLPGYLAAGRTGALLLLALAGAALVALVGRRARALGVPASRVAVLGFLLCVTYPLATFATQIWVELPGALAVATGLVLVAHRPSRRWAATALAVLASAMKTRLGLVTFPLAIVAWWPRRRVQRRLALLTSLAILTLAVAASLAVGWYYLGHPFGVYRRLPDLIPRRLAVPPIVVGGLTFDPAGGLAFTAPLLLIALGGARLLARRGGWGERALLAGSLATVIALLHSPEWYGGGSPPIRYLVPLLPAFALAGAMLLTAPRRWRRLGVLLLPPSLLSWWVLVSRPHLSVNPGDGGWWLSDALARRFGADTRVLFPSFLVPTPATVEVPLALIGAALLAAWLAHRHLWAGRLAALGVAVWLAAAAALVGVLNTRHDTVVEVEDAQVQRLGGEPEPPPGTYSRFMHPNGWRLAPTEGVVVPLNLAPGAAVRVRLWVDGAPSGTLEAGWDDRPEVGLPISAGRPIAVGLPPPPGSGEHRLHLTYEGPAASSVVLDRVVAEP